MSLTGPEFTMGNAGHLRESAEGINRRGYLREIHMRRIKLRSSALRGLHPEPLVPRYHGPVRARMLKQRSRRAIA